MVECKISEECRLSYHIPDESSCSSWMTSPQLKMMSSELAMVLSTITLYLPATWNRVKTIKTEGTVYKTLCHVNE